jgi:chemotaxis response regulator CheB
VRLCHCGLWLAGCLSLPEHLSTALCKPLRSLALADILTGMNDSRIEQALARIEAAMARIAAARETAANVPAPSAATSARVIELVNSHEKLREDVADTLRDLDSLIEQLEA